MTEPDWEGEGLLDGLEGRARDGRAKLLRELHADSVPLDELRSAVAEGRLGLLPAERALGEELRYSPVQIAELSGLDFDLLTRQWQAMGLPVRPDHEVAYGERDLEAARRVKQFVDAGLPEEGLIEMARVLGQALARVAEASRFMIGSAFLEPGSTEYDVAQQARMARPLVEVLEPTIAYVYGIQLVEQLRHDAMGQALLETGDPGRREMTVGFVDIVGWTELSEEAEEETIGGLADRLGAMVSEHLRAPVRVVKMVGDGAMLVSPETAPMLDLTLDLVDAAEADPAFPQLRGGVASGLALTRWGDWYGRPVNLASRVCSRARPGSVLVTAPVREACAEGYRFSQAGEKRLKGIGSVPLWRARRPEAD